MSYAHSYKGGYTGAMSEPEFEFDASDLYDATAPVVREHEWAVVLTTFGMGYSVCVHCNCVASSAPRSCAGFSSDDG